MKRLLLTLTALAIFISCGAQNQKARVFPNGIKVLGDPVITAVPATSHFMVLDSEGFSSRILLSDLISQLNIATGNLTQEEVEDILASVITSGTHSNITFTYNDNGTDPGTIDATATGSSGSSSGTELIPIIQSDFDLLTQQQKDTLDYLFVDPDNAIPGYGDMYKSVYDSDDNGTIDDSEALEGVAASNYARLDVLQTWTASKNFGDGSGQYFGADSDFGFYHSGGLNFFEIASGGFLRVRYLGTQYFTIGSSISASNGGTISTTDEPYDVNNWDGDNKVVTQNAIRDQLALMDTDGDGAVDAVEPGSISDTGLSTAFYQEGTFTPTLTDDGGGATYSIAGTNTGTYTRIGNKVFIDISMNSISTSGTPSGTLVIGNLPFSAKSGSIVRMDATMFGAGINYYDMVSTAFGLSALAIRYQDGLDDDYTTASSVTISGNISIHGFYTIN